ncbi:hypothetical protein ACFWUU_12760 [Kribbella sp. NPDC058693]|uniref:hypothetical protein n=1 Tax=Kribbella sp. NPDC058693 TaxID=3346602 RepID=UPI003669F60F
MFRRSSGIGLVAVWCCVAMLSGACHGDRPREQSNPVLTAGTSPPGASTSATATGTAPGESGPGQETTKSSRTTAPPATRPTTGRTTGSGGAEELALAEQIDLLAAGNGAASDCAADLEHLPASFAESPSIWISRAYHSEMPLEYGVHSALCLHGFDPGRAIDVRVRAGSVTVSTSVVPLSGEPNLDAYMDPRTLFSDRELPVYPAGVDLMISEMWMFVTIPEAREQFARGERLSLTAVQAGKRAKNQQEVATPTMPERVGIDGLPESRTRLLILGFKPGQQVPVGLYRANADESAQLVARLGSVRMTAARAAEFEVGPGVLDGRESGEYCVTVPLEEQFNCPRLP